jgi:hypothetical protein
VAVVDGTVASVPSRGIVDERTSGSGPNGRRRVPGEYILQRWADSAVTRSSGGQDGEEWMTWWET